ncbi:hypothetical protein CSUI_009507, partial [Cystoisospora suis]
MARQIHTWVDPQTSIKRQIDIDQSMMERKG